MRISVYSARSVRWQLLNACAIDIRRMLCASLTCDRVEGKFPQWMRNISQGRDDDEQRMVSTLTGRTASASLTHMRRTVVIARLAASLAAIAAITVLDSRV